MWIAGTWSAECNTYLCNHIFYPALSDDDDDDDDDNNCCCYHYDDDGDDDYGNAARKEKQIAIKLYRRSWIGEKNMPPSNARLDLEGNESMSWSTRSEATWKQITREHQVERQPWTNITVQVRKSILISSHSILLIKNQQLPKPESTPHRNLTLCFVNSNSKDDVVPFNARNDESRFIAPFIVVTHFFRSCTDRSDL